MTVPSIPFNRFLESLFSTKRSVFLSYHHKNDQVV